MPLHTYRCKKCGHEVEALVVGGRGEPKKCPKCSSSKLERRFGSFSCGGSQSGTANPLHAAPVHVLPLEPAVDNCGARFCLGHRR